MSPLAFRYSGEEVPAESRVPRGRQLSVRLYARRPCSGAAAAAPDSLTVGLGREVAAGQGVQQVDEELARLQAHDRVVAVGVERDDVEQQGEVDAEVLVVLVRQLAQHAQRKLGAGRLPLP